MVWDKVEGGSYLERDTGAILTLRPAPSGMGDFTFAASTPPLKNAFIDKRGIEHRRKPRQIGFVTARVP